MSAQRFSLQGLGLLPGPQLCCWALHLACFHARLLACRLLVVILVSRECRFLQTFSAVPLQQVALLPWGSHPPPPGSSLAMSPAWLPETCLALGLVLGP